MTKDSTISEFWWHILFLAIGMGVAVWAIWPQIVPFIAKLASSSEIRAKDDINYQSGFYQTSVASWQAWEGNEIIIEVSYFTNRYQETDDTPDITASGQTVREGIAANNCYEFGTKIEIDGQQYEVQDRMNRRYSCEHIDIFIFDYKEAIQKGRGIKIVKLLD